MADEDAHATYPPILVQPLHYYQFVSFHKSQLIWVVWVTVVLCYHHLASSLRTRHYQHVVVVWDWALGPLGELGYWR